MGVLACHPETGAQLVLDEGQLVHMRRSGWLLQSEHDAHEAAKADAAAKAEADAEKAASKSAAPAAKTGQEK